MPVQGPLAGVTILDLTRVLAGPYCTMLLSDLGARVIKVERPGRGDDSRAIGPFVGDQSAYFVSLNRGKESIALDLKLASDREIFDALLARADVLVENFRGGTMEKLGYGWESLQKSHPRLIYAAASGFGHTGPYAERPAYDMVVQAMGGIMSLTGQPGGPPTRVGSSIGDISAGLFTAIGINAALVERSQTSRGVKIDVSMLDSQVAILENAIARYCATGEIPGALGARHPSIAPFGAFATRDGHVVIAAGNDALFETLCATLDAPHLTGLDAYRTNALRTENADRLARDLEEALGKASTTEWLERLAVAGVPCGPINDLAAVFDDPQVRARNMLVTVEDPALEGLSIAGNPIKLSNHPDPERRSRAPGLDEHRHRLLAELGLRDS